ncbi:MAG: four helix bundle protein [bacterium]|nr:four helix bundle protein [bacterium]
MLIVVFDTMADLLTIFELNAWQKARLLRMQISKITKNFPKEEQYRLTDQIIRSSRSIPANIAEGFGCYYYNASINYYRHARGSLVETIEYISCAYDEGYVTKEVCAVCIRDSEEVKMLINGLIRSQNHSKKKI